MGMRQVAEGTFLVKLQDSHVLSNFAKMEYFKTRIGRRLSRKCGQVWLQARQKSKLHIDKKMKMAHLQTNRVLLHFLRALPFLWIWSFHAQIKRQLGPRLDLSSVILPYQLKKRPGTKRFAVTLGRCSEQSRQLSCIGGGWKPWVAV